MNSANYELARQQVSATYVNQGMDSRRQREARVTKLADRGWVADRGGGGRAEGGVRGGVEGVGGDGGAGRRAVRGASAVNVGGGFD